MPTVTINLPAGTAVTKQINLPVCGAWVGLVKVSLTTHTTNASIAEMLLIYSGNPDNKIRYRRTGGTLAGNYQNWTLYKDQRVERWLFQNESLLNLTYTAANEISVCVETTRAIQSFAYPSIPATAYPTEQQSYGVESNGKVYWKAAS